MNINLLIGLGAGIVSAMLFASASTGTVLGLFVLFFLSPLPVSVAGLGWGWRAAAIAAFAAALTVSVIGNVRGGVFHLLALGIPTAVLSYLALLSRDVAGPAGAPNTEWYPTGRIIAVAALISGALAALALLTTATDIDALRTELRGTFDRVFVRNMPLPTGQTTPLTEDQLNGIANFLIFSFAPALATMWLSIAMLNLWLAGLVVAKSDRLVRPWPDLSEIKLPPTMPLAFALTIACSFLPGVAGLIAGGFASAILLAYMLVGLAIIHQLTRGLNLRPMLLTGIYVALFLFYLFAGPIIAMIGLSEPFSPLRRPSSQRPPST